jgi:hypothetical protein
MNVRRGLIRLWLFASALWIAGVVTVAMNDANLHWTGSLSVAVPVAAGPAQPSPTAGAPSAQPAETNDADWGNDPIQGGSAQQAAPAVTFTRDPNQTAIPATKPSAAAAEPPQAAEAPNPYAKWAKPEQAQPAEANPYAEWARQPAPKAGPAQMSRGERFATGVADPMASLPSVIWKYASVALGVPIILLVLGAGVWWVAIGFRSGAPSRIRE